MSSFHFTVGIDSKSFSWPVHRTRNLPKFSVTSDAGCTFANVRRFGIGP